MKRISLKGVIVGNIIDILATNIVVLITSKPVGSIVGANPHILAESGAFKILSGILGGPCSVSGGYVAARLARHDELLNGALSSIIASG